MPTIINVGVAKLETASNPLILRTILGSCIGICIYDRTKKIGGLAHILLPESRDKANPEKYAETAIPLMLSRLYKEGCKKESLSAKIAGGASMFKFKVNSSLAKIGERNIEVTKRILEENGIPITKEDVGGHAGRTIDFFLEDGRLKVKSEGKEKIYYKV